MTLEWAAFHTLDFFMPLDGFTSRPGVRRQLSTFTTIIPFISIKVSITRQRWDQIMGRGAEILYAHIRRREKETVRAKKKKREKKKEARGNSRAMRLRL